MTEYNHDLNIHLVFVEQTLQILKTRLEQNGLTVNETDAALETFQDFMLSKESNAIQSNVALINGNAVQNPRKKEQIIYDVIKNVKLKHPQLKIVLMLGDEMKDKRHFIQSLIALGLYNIHFVSKINVDHIIKIVHSEKTLNDMSHYLTDDNFEEAQHEDVDFEVIESEIENQATDNEQGRQPLFDLKGLSIPIREKKVIEKTIVKETYISVPKNMIAICNITTKAGSTFISQTLSQVLREQGLSVTLVDMPFYNEGRTYLSDHINTTKTDGKFYSIPHMIADKQTVNLEHFYVENPKDDLIQYCLLDKNNREIEWSFEYHAKLFNLLNKTDCTILDIGSFRHSDQPQLTEILQHVDMVFPVFDATPAELMANEKNIEYFYDLLKRGIPLHFVMNKHNKAIKLKELEDIDFVTKASTTIPFTNKQFLDECIYEYKHYIDHQEIRKMIYSSTQELIKIVFPEITLKKEKTPKLKGFFSKTK